MKKSVLMSLALAMTLTTAAPAFAAVPQQTTPVQAEQAQPQLDKKVDNGKFYFGLMGGAIMPQEQKVTATAHGVTASAGKIEFDPGLTIGAQGGYHINEYLSAQVEGSYARLNPKNLEAMNNFMGFANAVVTPLGNNAIVETSSGSIKFVPYAFAGPGVLSLDQFKSKDKDDPAVTSRSTNLALNAGAGMNVQMGMFDVGARYQYIWANSAQTKTFHNVHIFGETIPKVKLKTDNFGAHVVTGEATVHF